MDPQLPNCSIEKRSLFRSFAERIPFRLGQQRKKKKKKKSISHPPSHLWLHHHIPGQSQAGLKGARAGR